jgi:hypothetical protein
MRGRAVEEIPAFGAGRLQPELENPEFTAAPYEFSQQCLQLANSDQQYARHALETWSQHFAQIGFYLQFRSDKSNDKLKRFHSHTELASAILDGRLGLEG